MNGGTISYKQKFWRGLTDTYKISKLKFHRILLLVFLILEPSEQARDQVKQEARVLYLASLSSMVISIEK